MHSITKREKITYTGSLLGQNMIYSLMTMYVMFFFTDLLRIPSQSVTIIMVAASLWDAVNDILMGMIADRTRTRIGKFRPYLLAGPVFIGIVTVLCFVSFGGSPAGTVAVAAVCYVLWGMTYTVYDIPIWAISSVSSRSADEKNGMVTLGRIGGTLGTVIVSVGSVSLLNAFGGERSAPAYTAMAAVIAGSGALLMLLSGFVLRERIEPPANGVPFRKNIHTILDNVPLKALMVTLLIMNMVNSIRQVAQMYFAVYVWGDSGYVTYIGLSLVLGMITGMAVSPALIRRYDKKLLYLIACIAGAVTSLLPYAFGVEPVVSLVILGFNFAFSGVTSITSTSMLMDSIDYAEYKLGFRGEGVVFSMNTFLTKLSATISKGILGVSMTLMGYQDNMEPNDTVMAGFSFIVLAVPAICFVLSMLPLAFYKLTPDKLTAIRNELETRRTAEK
ncbi:MAG: glycoside transporter [Clostridiales bacterium]|nr:glycoside-pentoside-hexuronide (GPH):cation symporter [Clostridiales bacterium]PWM40501.1 MAG: glycoside transporter [Clostridiales bacterium]